MNPDIEFKNKLLIASNMKQNGIIIGNSLKHFAKIEEGALYVNPLFLQILPQESKNTYIYNGCLSLLLLQKNLFIGLNFMLTKKLDFIFSIKANVKKRKEIKFDAIGNTSYSGLETANAIFLSLKNKFQEQCLHLDRYNYLIHNNQIMKTSNATGTTIIFLLM